MSYKELEEMLKEDRSGYVEVDWSEGGEAEDEMAAYGFWETDIDGQEREWDDRFDLWKFVRDFYIEIEVTTNEGRTTVGNSKFFINEKRMNDIPGIDWEKYLWPGEEMPID